MAIMTLLGISENDFADVLHDLNEMGSATVVSAPSTLIAMEMAGNLNRELIGTGVFDGPGRQARWTGALTFSIQIDTDGDRSAEFAVGVAGDAPLGPGDVLF